MEMHFQCEFKENRYPWNQMNVFENFITHQNPGGDKDALGKELKLQ